MFACKKCLIVKMFNVREATWENIKVIFEDLILT